MAISLVRIDDRLVHGQVVEGWVPHLKITEIVVVSAAAAADPMQQVLMQMALPERVALHVLAPAEAAARLRAGGPGNTLVLAPSPQEVLELLEGGVLVSTVNVGGLHHAAGRIQLGKVIFLGEDDRRALKAIVERGVVLEGRAVPSDRKMDVAGLLAGAA